jgi:hypothetical protein
LRDIVTNTVKGPFDPTIVYKVVAVCMDMEDKEDKAAESTTESGKKSNVVNILFLGERASFAVHIISGLIPPFGQAGRGFL